MGFFESSKNPSEPDRRNSSVVPAPLEGISWERLAGPHRKWLQNSQEPSVGPHELWPLVSHHRFRHDQSPIRGLGASDDTVLSESVITHLLVCHGLVLEDPLIRPIAALAEDPESHESAMELARVTRSMASLEPFIEAQLVTVTSGHL